MAAEVLAHRAMHAGTPTRGGGAPSAKTRPLTVAITGARSVLGHRLRERLEASDRVHRIVCLDLEDEPGLRGKKTAFERLDLTHPSTASSLAEVLRGTHATALVHLAFLSSPVRDPAYAHELEAIGTLHVFTACESAGVDDIVMSSSTVVYGASATNPSLLTEDRSLLGNPRSRWVCDRVEAEAQARRFAEAHPATNVSVLRMAAVLGTGIDNPLTRLLNQTVVPTLWGYDPLFQLLHPDDAVLALETALLARQGGVFNVAGEGVLPLSGLIRTCGSIPFPLPHPLARTLIRALDTLGFANVATSLIDYLRYAWVADTRRAREVLGFRPRYSTRAVAMDFARG